MKAILLAAATAAASTGALVAQPAADRILTLSGSFAADPSHRGPEALRWLRGQLSASYGIEADTALRVEWRQDASAPRLQIELATEDRRADENYANFELRSAADATTGQSQLIATGQCRWNGTAVWTLHAPEQLPPRVHALAKLCRLELHGTARAFDLASLAGQLAPTAASADDPLSQLIQEGAAACGTVQWVSQNADQVVRVTGNSPGGLLLPLVILAVADVVGSGGSDIAAGLRTLPSTAGEGLDEHRCWRLIAFASRDGLRGEAVAQLGRIADPAAIDTLERLLWSREDGPATAFTGDLRSRAVDGLLRAQASTSLGKIARQSTARSDTAASTLAEELTTAAIQNLWDRAPADVRSTVAAARPELFTAAAEIAGPPSKPAEQRDGDEAALRPLLLALCGLSLISLLVIYNRATQPKTSC